jgi:hypothetical protein
LETGSTTIKLMDDLEDPGASRSIVLSPTTNLQGASWNQEGAFYGQETVHASERNEIQRQAWRDQMQQAVSDEYVFIDESSTHLGFAPTRARAPRGERVVVRMQRNRGENITLIAALTSTCFTAAFTFEGGLDLLALEVYVNQILIPE